MTHQKYRPTGYFPSFRIHAVRREGHRRWADCTFGQCTKDGVPVADSMEKRRRRYQVSICEIENAAAFDD